MIDLIDVVIGVLVWLAIAAVWLLAVLIVIGFVLSR